MRGITFEELLKRAMEFERKLESYYAEIRDRTEDAGVRLLTYYLSRHRRHLEEATAALSPERREHIGMVRLRFDVPFEPDEVFKPMTTPPESVKSRELLDSAVRYDSTLVDLYRRILAQQVGPEAETFIESLVRLEEKDIVMLKKMLAMDYF
jgi:rubrerythrin